jgi:hypothetical protein
MNATHFAKKTAIDNRISETKEKGIAKTEKKPIMVIGATVGETKTLNKMLNIEISPDRESM